MRLYQILLPLKANDGATTVGSRAAFEMHAAKLAGGYTQGQSVEGSWQGPNGLQQETMVPYFVACEAGVWAELVEAAFAMFPDQKAIFTADAGEATIIERGAVPVIKTNGDPTVLQPFEIARARALLIRGDAARKATEHLRDALDAAADAITRGSIHLPSYYKAAAEAAAELEKLLA